MKKLALYSLFFLFAFMFFSVNNGNAQDISKYCLVGNVKSIREYHYKPLDDCDYCEDLQSDSSFVQFSLNGNIIKEIYYNYYAYNEFNKEVTTYKFNEKGKIVEKKKIGIFERYVETTKYIRDNQGYIIRKELYKKYLEDEYKDIYGEGDVLQSVEYRNNNTDGTAKEISYYNCSNNGKTLHHKDCYGENGYLLKTIYYYDKTPSEDTYSYDFYATGTIKQVTEVSFDRKEVSTYNEKGLITTYVRHPKDNNRRVRTDTYEYTYDSKGNWITMKYTEKIIGLKTEIDIYKRKITYYK